MFLGKEIIVLTSLQTLVFPYNLNVGGIVFLEKFAGILLEIEMVYLSLNFVNFGGSG